VHMPLFLGWKKFVVERNLPLQGSVAGNLCSAAIEFSLAYLVAAISWQFFEMPLLRLKKYFPSGSALQRPVDELETKESAVLPASDAT